MAPHEYRVIFELIWRDYFKFFTIKHGTKIFLQDGVIPRPGAQWRREPSALARWRDGRTGWPLVDANMRELKATGDHCFVRSLDVCIAAWMYLIHRFYVKSGAPKRGILFGTGPGP